MVALPQFDKDDPSRAERSGEGGGCGSACGAGLEKIYPSTAVRYGAMRWIGEFSYKPGTVFRCGGKVVIQSDRGIEIGEQVSLTCHGCERSVSREQIKRYIANSGAEFYRLGAGRILRGATPQDLDEQEHLNSHVHDDIDHAAMLAAQLDLDLKIVTVEHLLGGERIVFYFRSESRVDFRQLVKELAHHHRTRIEMRQVGARDEARLVADYEICGRECCCKNFLKKLRPVNMKMAKLQKSTLDPAKVSGRCGRLRCCLRYEHESYEELNAKLPRVGQRVLTEFGEATVIDRQILTQLVLVRTDDQRDYTIPNEELKPLGGGARPRLEAADASELADERDQRLLDESRPRRDRPAGPGPGRRPEGRDRSRDDQRGRGAQITRRPGGDGGRDRSDRGRRGTPASPPGGPQPAPGGSPIGPAEPREPSAPSTQGPAGKPPEREGTPTPTPGGDQRFRSRRRRRRGRGRGQSRPGQPPGGAPGAPPEAPPPPPAEPGE
jgi:cell fate regulator YaaT (PSP1 superfamily)